MSRSLLVTRTSLSLADLQLWAPPTYVVHGDTFGPGPQVFRREFVTGPYTAGRFLIGMVPDTQIAQGVIQVTGTSGSDLESNISTLLAAVSQSSFTMTAVWDGVTAAWQCEAADHAVGANGLLEDHDFSLHVCDVSLAIPRSPVPVSGAF